MDNTKIYYSVHDLIKENTPRLLSDLTEEQKTELEHADDFEGMRYELIDNLWLRYYDNWDPALGNLISCYTLDDFCRETIEYITRE